MNTRQLQQAPCNVLGPTTAPKNWHDENIAIAFVRSDSGVANAIHVKQRPAEPARHKFA